MKKTIKYIAVVLAGLLALFVVAALVIPFVVNVDKFRPQIVQKANENINGTLELGKLSLSLWGQVRIDVAGLSVQDQAGRKLLSVKDAYFHLPFASILGGAPVLTFKMQRPVINVLKDKNGKINLLSLVKSGPEAGTPATSAADKPAPALTAPSAHDPGLTLPAIATRARLGVELRNALLTYGDEVTHLSTQVKDLNLIARDISLSRPMKLEVWADLDSRMGEPAAKAIVVKGPVKLTGQAQPKMTPGGRFEQLAMTAQIDLNSLEIKVPELFEKTKDTEANADLALKASENEVSVDHFNARFFNAEFKSSGTISNFSTAAGQSFAPVVIFNMRSNDIELKPWVKLIPMLKDFELGGIVRLEANAKGPAEKLGYRARISATGVTAKAPKLKARPRVDGVINIITDQVESMNLTMKAPGNDLSIRGKVLSFAKPRVDLEVTSPGMDLDQLVEFPAPGKKDQGAPAAPASPVGTEEPAKRAKAPGASSDFDALLAPVRENKILRATVADVNVNIRSVKAYDIKMTELAGKLFFRDLNAGIEQFSMKLWNGSIKASGAAALASRVPTYKFGAQILGLDLSQAVASQFRLFKNTLLGTANFDMTGEGQSFNPEPAISNLKAKGSMRVEKATFATIDIGKMVSEALTKSIEKIADKVPAVKNQLSGKKFGLPSGQSRYDVISSNFTVAGGKFAAPNFIAKAAPNQGIDLKGNVLIGMKDYSLQTNWELVDTYNLTGAKDLAVEQAGVKVEHILAEGNQPVRFPVHVGCQIFAPCYSYTEVPEFLAKVAVGNMSAAAQGKAKAELKKKADSLIQKAPPAVQKRLEDFGKKLFR